MNGRTPFVIGFKWNSIVNADDCDCRKNFNSNSVCEIPIDVLSKYQLTLNSIQHQQKYATRKNDERGKHFDCKILVEIVR